jgi:inner membrane protein
MASLFAPFDNTRYFLPWRPIVVSPIGVGAFFSRWGLEVLASESVWVGIPAVVLAAAAVGFRAWRRRRSRP